MLGSFVKSRRFDHMVGLILAGVYVAILLATAKDIGYARDEGFYFKAARDYQGWFDLLSEDSSAAFDEASVDRFWRYNHEHPALMKTAFGFSERIFYEKLGWMSPSTALRFPGMLCAGLCVYLLFIWGSYAFTRRAGLFAAVAFAAMPRVFYHAHLCCFDMGITAFWLLVFYLYWRSLSSKRFGIAAGIAFGFALCVKLNAFFLPFVLGFHFAVLYLRWRKRGRALGQPAPKAWAFVSGLIAAPVIFFAHWPWLWYDTLHRVGIYMGFHSNHPHYNTAYFGENIIQAPTPISYPFVLTLFTVPTVVVLLFAVGGLIRLRRHLPERLERLVPGAWSPPSDPSSNGHDFLLLLGMAFPICLIAMPNVPVFGGTKHWMPAMPFIALLAGYAASRLMDRLGERLKRVPFAAVAAVMMLLLLAPPIQQTATSHPFGLASYVPFVGGAPGAASKGMLRQFWGYTTEGVLPWLNERVRKGGRVWLHDTAVPSAAMFKQEGKLRRDVRNSMKIRPADYAILHHELHMIRNESWIWNIHKNITPAHVLTYQGVPIVSVYEKPAKPKPKAAKPGKTPKER